MHKYLPIIPIHSLTHSIDFISRPLKKSLGCAGYSCLSVCVHIDLSESYVWSTQSPLFFPRVKNVVFTSDPTGLFIHYKYSKQLNLYTYGGRILINWLFPSLKGNYINIYNIKSSRSPLKNITVYKISSNLNKILVIILLFSICTSWNNYNVYNTHFKIKNSPQVWNFKVLKFFF